MSLFPLSGFAPSATANESSAIEFLPSEMAVVFRNQNALRPETDITITGPDSSSYYLGLAIVPIVLIAILALWLVMVIAFGYCQRRCQRAFQGSKCSRRVVWAAITLMLLGSLVAWICAFAYSISAITYQEDLRTELDTMQAGLRTVDDMLINFDAHIASTKAAMEGIRANCGGNMFQEMVVAALGEVVDRTINGVETLINKAKPVVNKVTSEMDNYSSSIMTFLKVRTIVFSSISGVQILVVLFLFSVSLVKLVSPKRLQWINRGCGYKRCCSPILGISIVAIILMIVLSAVLYVIALALSDLCAPNVNTSINRIAGEFLEYPEFADFEGYNLTEMCNLQNSSVMNRPMELSFLCFYQTCDPQNQYAQLVLLGLQNSVTILQVAESQSATLLSQLEKLLPDNMCVDNLGMLAPNFVSIISDASASLNFLACPNINRIYAAAVYNNVCSPQVDISISVFRSWISGTVLLMVALALWLGCRDYLGGEPDREIVWDSKLDRNVQQSPRTQVLPSPTMTSLRNQPDNLSDDVDSKGEAEVPEAIAIV